MSPELSLLHGSDTEGFQLVRGPPKTAAGDRRIPIPDWLCDKIASLLEYRAEKRGTPTVADELIFQTRYGNPINRDKSRQDVIRPALRAAGLPESFRTYDLRHPHASLLIELGANLLALAQRTGHSDPAITLRMYGHLFEGTRAELSRQPDGLRAATAPGTQHATQTCVHRTTAQQITHPLRLSHPLRWTFDISVAVGPRPRLGRWLKRSRWWLG